MRWPTFAHAASALLLTAACSAQTDTAYERQRADLSETVAREVRVWTGEPLDPAVMRAIATVPRHELVPENLRRHAYLDQPLPIGHGQTISQPGIVALMTHLLHVAPGDTVLEVGTGSGYQAAVLAEMGVVVHTIEIVPELAARARADLERLGYANATVVTGDGYRGLPEHAPFDGIIVTAAPDHVPQPLLDQLAPGARLVIPVGAQDAIQQLTVYEKTADGEVGEQGVLPVRFVPLVRE